MPNNSPKIYMFEKSGTVSIPNSPSINFLDISLINVVKYDTFLDDLQTKKRRDIARDKRRTIIILNIDDLLLEMPSLRSRATLTSWLQRYNDIMTTKFKKVLPINLIYIGNPIFYDQEISLEVGQVIKEKASLNLVIPEGPLYRTAYNYMKIKSLAFRGAGSTKKRWLLSRTNIHWFLREQRRDHAVRKGYIYALNVAIFRFKRSVLGNREVPSI